MTDLGNQLQVQAMVSQVAREAAAAVLLEQKANDLDRPTKDAPIPPIVKWLVGAIGAFGSAALIGLGFWLVTSVSTMRETLARMDERQIAQTGTLDGRFGDQERRIVKLEGYHSGDGK